MPKVAVLVPCSSSKTVEALAGARAASLPQGPQRSVEAAWLGQLRGLEGVRPARDLYDGRAFGIAREACELWRQDIDCRLYIVSAGLGLVPSPGPGFDFSARALKHFVTVVWPRHPHCGSEAELAEHQRLVRDAMSAASEREGGQEQEWTGSNYNDNRLPSEKRDLLREAKAKFD